MTRKLTFPALVALLLTMAFATFNPVVAQTATPDPVDELDRIASNVTIFGRTYSADPVGTPVPGATQPVMTIVQAYLLDDAETAEAAFPFVQQIMTEQLEAVINVGFETVAVEDLGTNATLSTAEIFSVTVALYLVQDENVIYLSASVATSGAAEDVALEFLTFMLDQEPGDVDAVEFDKLGVSTGGYFDVMPTLVDTDILHGMTPTEDMYDAGDE